MKSLNSESIIYLFIHSRTPFPFIRRAFFSLFLFSIAKKSPRNSLLFPSKNKILYTFFLDQVVRCCCCSSATKRKFSWFFSLWLSRNAATSLCAKYFSTTQQEKALMTWFSFYSRRSTTRELAWSWLPRTIYENGQGKLRLWRQSQTVSALKV